MSPFVMSKHVELTDDEMQHLEFLCLHGRNEWEHFVPKTYTATVEELAAVTLLALDAFFKGKVVFKKPVLGLNPS